jgi:two-component system LytT family response regulator
MMLTALIVDDEPLARTHLRRLLEAQQVEVIGEAENAAQALQRAEDLRPHLLFLDIQMPGLTGMQAASALLYLEEAPLLIFVTGFSEHAVAAFEHDALDYLVKPVAPDRLAKTLVRARERLANHALRDRARARVMQQAQETSPLRRLPVRKDYTVHLVRVEEVVYAFAREKRVFVRTAGHEHRTYYTLTQLETLLPSDRFVRIHDSYLVNLDFIEEILFLGNHSYAVRLSDGSQLPVGRTRYPELQRRLGLDDGQPS